MLKALVFMILYPTDPTIKENPPYIGFSLLDEKLVPSIDCFVFDSKGQVEKELFKFNERIEIRLKRKLLKVDQELIALQKVVMVYGDGLVTNFIYELLNE